MLDKFFGNSKFRGTITVIGPIVIGGLLSAAISLTDLTSRVISWVLFAIFTILFIIFLVMGGKYDDEKKTELSKQTEKVEKLQKDLIKTENQFNTLLSVYKKISKILHNYSNDLHSMVNKKKGHSEINNWKYLQSNCNIICEELLNLVKRVSAYGENFSVSVIFKRTASDSVEFNMLSRASYSGHYPGMYDVFKNENVFKNYHFKRLFEQKSTRPNYLFSEEEIRAVFSNCDEVKYSQYIGIPIACKGNKIIAILQIISYEDSKIAKTRQHMTQLYDEYFCTFSNLILLADKIENIEQLIN